MTFEGVRTFLFDLDGTLRQVKPTSQEALLTYAEELGYPIDDANRRRAVLWSHSYWADVERVRADLAQYKGHAFWEQYIRRFAQALKLDDVEKSAAALSKRFASEFKPTSALASGVKELLWGLRSQQFTVGLISNRSEPLTGEAIELGIIEHLNFTLAAGQIDAWKPNPAIFEAALDMAGVAKGEAVYIGDNYYADVVGAQRAGIQAVLLDKQKIYGHVSEQCLVINDLSDLAQHIPKGETSS